MPNLSLSGILGNASGLNADAPPQQPLAVQPPPAAPPLRNRTIPAEADPSGALVEATNRDLALQAAAAQAAPNSNENAAIAAALGTIGNIAGAVSGQGAVGDSALALSEQMRQEARLQQESFFRRVRDEEARIGVEKAARDQAINNKLIGDSLKPLIRGIKDPQEQAMFLQLINSGQVNEARQALYQRQQQQLQNQMDQLNMDMKRQQHSISQTKGLQDITRNNLDLQNAGASGFEGFTPGKQREEFQKQSKEFETRLKNSKETIQKVAKLDELLGGIDSPEAVEKLARISGFLGTQRGSNKFFGNTEDKDLYTAVNSLVSDLAHEKFGAAFTESEQAMIAAGLGRSVGERTLGNVLRDPRAFAGVLGRLRDESREKLAGAERGLDQSVLNRFTEYGRPTSSLQAFEAHLQANKELKGGIKSLENLPPQLAGRQNAQEEWLQMTPIQKKQILIQIRRAGAAQ